MRNKIVNLVIYLFIFEMETHINKQLSDFIILHIEGLNIQHDKIIEDQFDYI